MTTGRVKTITTINGRRVSQAKAVVSVFDNALLYAEGLFETFLVIDDRVVLLEEHLDRLYKGAATVGLKIPVGRKRLREWINQTVTLHPSRTKKLRLTVTSGEAARWVGVSGKGQVILSAAPHRIPRKPFRLLVSDFRVDQDSEFRRIKTISYAIHAAALKVAHRLKHDDALLLNRKGHVAEVTTANIFWVKNSIVYTPPLSAGCLEGVTRQVVLKVAEELGIRIKEKSVPLSGLVDCEELFISSSLKLVAPVGGITSGDELFAFPSGPLTRLFQEAMRRRFI